MTEGGGMNQSTVISMGYWRLHYATNFVEVQKIINVELPTFLKRASLRNNVQSTILVLYSYIK